MYVSPYLFDWVHINDISSCLSIKTPHSQTYQTELVFFLTCVNVRLAVCLLMAAVACPNHNLTEQTQRLLGYQLNK